MRGKALKTMPKQRHCRITPAYAGKSAGYQSGRCGNQDHPRLCGEKYAEAFAVADLLRIPPAYAGKSTTCHSGCPPEQDHPRLCGEKDTIAKLKKAG